MQCIEECGADPSTKPRFEHTAESLEGRVRVVVTNRGRVTITERSMYEVIRTDRGTQEIDATRITMAELAEMLSFVADRTVVDKTGLTGLYRFRIELPPFSFGVVRPPEAFKGNEQSLIEAPTGVLAFKAVETIGLTLEPRRSLQNTVVVDRIERVPTDN